MTSEVQTAAAAVAARQSSSSNRTSQLSQHQQSDATFLNTESVGSRLAAQSGSSSNNKFGAVQAANSRGSAIAAKQFVDFESFKSVHARDSIDSDIDLGDKENSLTTTLADVEVSKQQHHVGPVMGIFFKVWSLVKVTRVRHHQKMRRQNSEGTGRFQYISGEQYAAASATGSTRASAMLEDRHFRRAGSQPAPSCSMLIDSRRPALESSKLLVGQSGYSSATRLQPSSATVATTTTTMAVCNSNNVATGSNSTSSGVSSSTSSTLANTSPPSSSVAIRRHQNNRSSNNSWTSRIKRSTTSVNQRDASSYTSRFRFSQQNRNKQQQQQQQQQQKQQQQQQQQSQPQLKQKQHQAQRKTQQTFGTDYSPDYELAGGDTISSEDDSNDIYSTPNDSIQSVLFSAPLISQQADSSTSGDKRQAKSSSSAGQGISPQAASSYPIIKSFSTTNFSQLVQQQQQIASAVAGAPHQQLKFAPIDELLASAQSENLKNFGQKQKPTQSQKSSEDLKRQDSNHSAASAGGKRLSGSRFFISSSSSEDSNSLNQQQQQRHSDQRAQTTKPGLNSNQQQQQQQQQASLQLEQQHRQVSLQQGVHFHSPSQQQQRQFISRPDSLRMDYSSSTLATPSSILIGTPTPTTTEKTTPATAAASTIAAQSPLDFMPCSRVPTTYLRSAHYRRSPSLFEISRNQLQPGSSPSSRLAPVGSRFSSKYPQSVLQPISATQKSNQIIASQQLVSTFKPPLPPPLSPVAPPGDGPNNNDQQQQQPKQQSNCNSSSLASQNGSSNRSSSSPSHLSNSISLYDCKLSNYLQENGGQSRQQQSSRQQQQLLLDSSSSPPPPSSSSVGGNSIQQQPEDTEYKLAQMLLEFGSNPNARDASGYTVLMQAILSDSLPTIKCLIERGVNLNETNHDDLSALDLACSKAPTAARIEILKLLIENRANLDRSRESDGTRLLDRLIAEHRSSPSSDKLPFIDFLLQNGAKLGSATWLAASGKHDVQLRLLKKLCQDGYFLYKQLSIEAAVYRFEYALKRVAELEQQLAQLAYRPPSIANATDNQLISITARQIKYQTYLGLSRCERKRRFYKRALEFAHMAILVDSTAYEGYYSKAHILKDLGEIDDSLMAIDQTSRLVDKSIESIQIELRNLQHQEETLIYDGCFNLLLDSRRSNWIESNRLELNGNLDYLMEAKKYVAKLRGEILDDKLKVGATNGIVAKNENPAQIMSSSLGAAVSQQQQQQIVSI